MRGKTLILWRRVRDDKEEYTVETDTGIYQAQPRERGGYYTRDSLKTILKIDLTKDEPVI